MLYPLRCLCFVLATLLAPLHSGCSPSSSVTVEVDGSSTVYLISAAVAEDFGASNPTIRPTVGLSGTGGGFKRFCAGETAVSNASRPIQDLEAAKAKENGVEYIELPIAFDGLSVVVHSKNTFVDSFTVDELKRIWEPGSKVRTWQDVRASWPAQPIRLYGPGPDSGTFDYFTEAIVGKSKACRTDATFSEDDNVLVRGVAGDESSLGFMGFAYYEENHALLRAIPIDGGKGPVAPSAETIRLGTYAPLSRPLFIYASVKHLQRPEVKKFVEYYLDRAPTIVSDVKYIPLPAEAYELARRRLADLATGSLFQHARPGADVVAILRGVKQP
ncbi:MAG: PstS family phosphate ABC transporter substrate-binding protein [Planctomycetota bacterium]